MRSCQSRTAPFFQGYELEETPLFSNNFRNRNNFRNHFRIAAHAIEDAAEQRTNALNIALIGVNAD